ncbi:MAG: hypothetical protein AMXMBFR53_08530 [Gemmatimonadota bacterium]
MPASKSHRPGRIMGILLLVQLAGLIVPFIMMGAVATPDYLVTAAAAATPIRWALLLLLGNGVLTTALSIALHPRLRTSSPALSPWLIILGAGMVMLQASDNVHVMGMLSLSRAHVSDTLVAGPTLDVLGSWAAATRRTSHYLLLLAVGAWMIVFYSALWRARLVPRVLAAFGVTAAALHITGVSLPALLGVGSNPIMAMVLALSHPALAVRLIARGFDERTEERLT